MIDSPVWYVAPTYYLRAGGDPVPESGDPIGTCIKGAVQGDTIQLLPGNFPRIRGPFNGKHGIHICGWSDDASGLQSIVQRDTTVGSSDTFLLGPGDGGFILEQLSMQADDRAAIKTTSGVGHPNGFLDCMIYGNGSPHDPAWKDDSKWGIHTYETSGWQEIRNYIWSIYGEHARYHHNIQGIHNYVNCVTSMCGGCDTFFANRMNEGPIGKGDINIQGGLTEDVCIGQGGSALTFRGGMPTTRITINGRKIRLGCKKTLAAPFNQNICGAIVCDNADETAPGKNDAAYPGGQLELNLASCDIEVGTIYPGRTGMIRPVVDLSAIGRFTMKDTRIKVTRAPGAYPIALSIKSTVKAVEITGQNDIQGWVEWHPDAADAARYSTWALFQTAHPECFA